MLFPLITMNSCKDEAKNVFSDSFNSLKVSVSIDDSLEINKQLTWIAKGVAGMAHNYQHIKPEIHAQVEITDFNSETNQNLQNYLSGMNFNYSSEVANWLQTNIPSNDYDGAYFFDINISACLGKTSILIPDAEDIDQLLLHVVTPSFVTLDGQENVIGYYINTSTQLLDSLWINEDNMDSVYLWIVEIDLDCDTGFGKHKINPYADCTTPLCDLGIGCRWWCGNTPENCSACEENTSKDPSIPDFSLYLQEAKLLTDFKRHGSDHPLKKYQEHYLKGKYEIRFGYGVWEGDYTSQQSNLVFEPKNKPPLAAVMRHKMGFGEGGFEFHFGDHPAHKKGGVKRTTKRLINGNPISNKGTSPRTVTQGPLLLYRDYTPDNVACAFYLIEEDKNQPWCEITIPDGTKPSNTRFLTIFSARKPYSYVENQNLHQPCFSDHVHVLPLLTEWTQISLNPLIYEYVINFQEAELTFRLVQN